MLEIIENVFWDESKPVYEQSQATQDLVYESQGGQSISRTWENCLDNNRRSLTKAFRLSAGYILTVQYIYTYPPDSPEFGAILDFKFLITNG